jgi:hypothetical protein
MFKYNLFFVASAWHMLFQKNKHIMDIILTIVYLLVFAVVFWLFFKSVNYFEKI